jgi:hypothetical protein
MKKKNLSSLQGAPKNDQKCCISSCSNTTEINEYCRFHYIMHWNRIKKVERVEAERRLNKYIEEITKKYPTEYLEIIKKNLEDTKSLEKIVQDMNLEDDMDFLEDTLEEKELENMYRNIKTDSSD